MLGLLALGCAALSASPVCHKAMIAAYGAPPPTAPVKQPEFKACVNKIFTLELRSASLLPVVLLPPPPACSSTCRG